MIDAKQLQTRLGVTADGDIGPGTKAAILAAITDPPDTPISAIDVENMASVWGVDPAVIWAVRDVEASGSGFIDGRPTILFEPHRFSRATGHRFDASHPTISYRNWQPGHYPRTQAARWDQLLEAVSLDVDAGFASASYGAFQILGENFAACHEPDSFSFALAEAQGEAMQLRHFGHFVENAGLVERLRRLDWTGFASRYNGTGFAANQYDTKLAAACARRRAMA